MHRYMIFAFNKNSLCGGINDLIGRTNSVSEARRMWENNQRDFHFIHVYDTHTGIKYENIDILKRLEIRKKETQGL